MKKFLTKLLIFFCIVGIPFLGLNAAYQNTNFYRSMNELYWLKNYPDQIELLNLGNSHAMASLRYSKFYDGVAHNFATSSQPFFYDYGVLRHVEDSVAPGAVVIIPVSYFDWFYNYPKLFGEDVDSYNRRYYSLLPPQYMYDYDFEEHVKYGLLPVLTAKENLQYIFHDVNLPQLDAVDLTCHPNKLAIAQGKADAWINEVMELGEGKQEILQTNVSDFKKLVDYCYEKGYTPVVITLPVTQELTAQFSAQFLEEFDAITQDVLSEYPGLVYLDYSRDAAFSTHPEYFRDSDHLNSIGGDLLTQRLLRDLADRGILSAEKIIK